MKIYTPASVTGGYGSGPCCRLRAPAARSGEAESADHQYKRLSDLGSALPHDGNNPALQAAVGRLWTDMRREMLERCAKGEFVCAEDAVRRVSGELSGLLRASGDAYLRARAEDISAIGEHMLRRLSGAEVCIPRGCVLVTEKLSVLEAMEAVRCGVAAVIVGELNSLSHAALILSGSNVPVASGFETLEPFTDGTRVLVDHRTGRVTVDPDEIPQQPHEEALPAQSVRLADRTALSVALNCCGSWEQLPEKAPIGLLRTEFFVQSLGRLPTEDELADEYRCILSRNPVADIRLFDAGGDKQVPGLCQGSGVSPKPAQSGIALLLRRPEVLSLQLRAILRSAVGGEVRILLPMLGSPEELDAVRACMRDCAAALEAEGIPRRGSLPVGAMIETPEAALQADDIARACDFASIGTNDLTCRAMGISRTEGSGPQPDESVFRLIRSCADAFSRARKPLCVCGDLAADPAHVRRLVSLGIRRISVPACAAPKILRALAEEPLQV